mgnify:CR=1 FL=1|tara:strand:- start:5307 stop:5615 length:309 start_codon:yes stop_codon:yes gene_type:complete
MIVGITLLVVLIVGTLIAFGWKVVKETDEVLIVVIVFGSILSVLGLVLLTYEYTKIELKESIERGEYLIHDSGHRTISYSEYNVEVQDTILMYNLELKKVNR